MGTRGTSSAGRLTSAVPPRRTQLLEVGAAHDEMVEVAGAGLGAAEGAAKAQGIMAELHARVVGKGTPDELTAQQKELYSAISKLAKTVDKHFAATPLSLRSATDLRQDLVVQLIASHYLREGRFGLANALAEEAGLPLDLLGEAENPFKEMHAVIRDLRAGHLDRALRWVQAHTRADRPDLQLRGLEFRLHRIRYLGVVQGQGRAAAIQYMRRCLSQFADTHAAEIQRLMACLLFADRLGDSPYADLLAENSLEGIEQEFIRRCCNSAGQAYESPLAACVAAGAVALPVLMKLSQVMAFKKQDWTSCEQLPVEIELGNEFTYYSVFACPVSKDQSTPENPPMMLPCGHVLCQMSLRKLAKGGQRQFKCPYCPQEAHSSQCREVIFG